MGRARRARRERRPPLQPVAEQTDWRQHLIVIGVIQHPTAGHEQV
jgi:hypothetical protein